jgi:hypothetical protein
MNYVLAAHNQIGGVLAETRRFAVAGASSDWWLAGGISASNAVAVYKPVGADDLADSYINLANPGTYDATPGVAPTWDAVNGWTFNGSTQYLNSGVVFASHVWTIIIKFSGVPTSSSGRLFGALTGSTNGIFLQPYAVPTILQFRNAGTGFGTNQTSVGSGVLAISRNTLYRNGVVSPPATDDTEYSTGLPAMFIGGASSNGNPQNFIAGKIQALAIYNTTLTAAQVAAVTTEMQGLGGIPEWALAGGIDPANAVAVYQPIGADSLADSYVNLANPGTYDATPGVAPTWDAVNGWTFNGSTQYLDSGVVPATNYSMLIRYSNSIATSGYCYVLGIYEAPTKRFYIGSIADNDKVIYGNGQYLFVSPKLESGVLGMAGNQGYRNGIADGAAISTGGPWTLSIKIASIGSSNYGVKVQAVAIYNTTLTAAQVAAVTAGMQAL